MIKIDENSKITIKPQLLRNMTARLEYGEGSSSVKEELKEDDMISITSEMSGMTFELARHSVDKSMSLDRKVVGYITRTVSEPLYDDELVKNMTMEICFEVTNTYLNSIYIPINICLEGYNKYDLCAYIDSTYSDCFGKNNYFQFFVKKS